MVEGWDVSGVVAQVAAAGGPRLRQLRSLPGGGLGAALVRWPDGHDGALTWSPPPRPAAADPGRLERAVELVGLARAVGSPAPAYEAVVPLADGSTALLQQLAPGEPVTTISPELVEDPLADVARRRHLLRDRPDLQVPVSLHLRASGPGYCLHEPLAADPRTVPLLERIRAIGAEPGADELVGDDLVHYDLHPGNVLVAGDPPRLSAIVDWGAATSGDVALDLAVLSADLAAAWERRASSGCSTRRRRSRRAAACGRTSRCGSSTGACAIARSASRRTSPS